MVKKINDFLAGWYMTVIAGIFLIASFVIPKAGYAYADNLAWVTIVICGLPLLYLAIWRIIYNKGISKISSALLICMAMIAAILIGDIFAAGEVVFIMQIGALLEEKTTARAKQGLTNLIALAPQKARVVKDGEEVLLDVAQVKKGDVLRVLPGEVIPVDGKIITGETSIDQSVMTGESLPIDKTVGDEVYSGTINRFGFVEIEALKVGEDSSLQKLIRMVEEVEKNQAPTQRIADKWASFLVPFALLIAIVTYLITGDVERGVAVLVVFCPCALVLATPTAIMAAIGQATKYGVIIKSGEALEKMGRVDTVAFDKTGTLTYGKLTVSDVAAFEGADSAELFKIAASAEKNSEHPLGKAITAKAKEDKIELYETRNFKMFAGRGISATIGEKLYYFGNEKYIAENGIAMGAEALEMLEKAAIEGKACVIAGDEQKVIGIITLSDVLRPEAKDVIDRLSAMDIKTVLLTGDKKTAAEFFGNKVGISEIHAQLLPQEKVENVEEIKRNGTVCMIGDGVNDAPALKIADVGVAMGVMGSDIAISAADIALMTEDILKIPYLKWLSNMTVKTIKIAITLSMCINFVGVMLSAMGILTPTTGALVHNAGSVVVVFIAGLLYDKKYKW